MGFVHLHVHDMYSPLEGMGKPSEYVALAKQHGHPALAITNNGNLFNAFMFYTECKKEGIKSIIGQEFYMAESDHMSSQDSNKQRRLVLLAKNQTGWKNLVKLSTLAYLEGRYYVPRIDTACLAKHSEGLIALSAGLKGVLGTYFQAGEEKTAQSIARKYRDIFGDDFYLEMLPHLYMEQTDYNRFLMELSKLDGFKLVAANDCRYPKEEHGKFYDFLVMIKSRIRKSDMQHRQERFEHFYRTEDQMLDGFVNQGFQKQLASIWLNNTLEVADKVSELTFDKSFKLPAFDETPVQMDQIETPLIETEEEDAQLELVGDEE